jgi:hypothetical protein
MKKNSKKLFSHYKAIILAVIGVLFVGVIGYKVVEENGLSNFVAEAGIKYPPPCVVNGFIYWDNQKGNEKCYHGRSIDGKCQWGRAAMYLKTKAECKERCRAKKGTWVEGTDYSHYSATKCR